MSHRTDETVNEQSRPFLGKFALVSVGRFVAAILQAVSLGFAIRLLSPAEFGLLAGVLGIAPVAQSCVDMGVPTFISRERASTPTSGAIATALRFNRVTSLGLALLAAACLTLAGLLIDDIYLLMLPLAVWVSGERNADARLSVAFADGDVRVNVFNLVSRRVAALTIFLSAVRLDVEPVLAFALGSALAAAGSSVFANAYIRSRVVVPPSISYRTLLQLSWPYWLDSVATQARNLDVIVTTAFAGATQAGFYSLGSRLTSPLRLLPASLASVLVPAAARSSSSSQSTKPLLRATLALIALMTIVYGLLFAASPWLVPTAFGTAQEDAVPVIQMVLVGLPFAAAASLFGALLQGVGRRHVVATASTATTVSCLTAIAVVAGPFGALGAAAALSGAFVLQAAILVSGFISYTRSKSSSAPDVPGKTPAVKGVSDVH